jgi:excisionase family DNA binding protein
VSERLVTARELAEHLGLSPDTVLDWFEAGRLPGFKLGGRAVRFRESEILAWLESHRVGRGREEKCHPPLPLTRPEE